MRSVIPVLSLAVLGACGSEELDCARAFEIISSCDHDSDPDVCGDDAPAVQLFDSGECGTLGEKGDVLGNRSLGEACTFRWQCDLGSGLTCLEGVCNRFDIEEPCALPAGDYMGLTPDQKLDVLFSLHEASPTVRLDAFGEALFALERVLDFLVRPRGAEKIVHTLTRSCDVFAEPTTKRVHALGTVAKARLVFTGDSPYTGLLAPGAIPALIRFSIANPVTGVSLPELIPDLEFIPGIGIKLFVDGRESESILAMNSLAGQGDVHNYFLHDFTNNFSAHAPRSNDPAISERYEANPVNHEVMAHVGARFHEALKMVHGGDGAVPFHRPINRLARVRVDGTDVADPVSPDWLVFRPTADVRSNQTVVNSDPTVDFREKLANLGAGDHVFEILAVTGGVEKFIGFLELDSAPRPSEWGDHELFIQHAL